MYTVYVCDLPLLVVCLQERGEVKLMIIILYQTYAVTSFIKHIYFKNDSVLFHSKF